MNRGTRTVASSVALTALLAATVSAQAGPPTVVQKAPPTFRVHLSGIDELPQVLEQQRIYPLLEDYGLIELFGRQIESGNAAAERERQIRAEVARRGIQPEPSQLTSLIRSSQEPMLGAFGKKDLRQLEMQMRQWRDEDGFYRSAQVVITSCAPRANGRWAKQFQDEVAWWRDCGWFETVDGVKVGGLPVSAFRVREGDDAQQNRSSYEMARWFLELPGAYVVGSASPDALGAIGDVELAPPAKPPGVHYEASLAALAEQPQGGMVDPVERLLAAGLAAIRLDVQPDGDLMREQIEFVLGGEWGTPGVVDVLTGGTGPLTPQALPDGAMLQLRVNLSIPKLVELFEQVVQTTPIGDALTEAMPKLLDGGLTLGVCAPAPGGVIPRVYLTVGLQDVDGFQKLMAGFREQGMPCKDVTYDDVVCTIVEIPDVPQGIQPTWCVVDGRLHIAESPLSMRAYLRAQQDGVETMQLEEPLVASDVPGEPLKTMELRFDPARAYQAFYDLWMPLLDLSVAAAGVRSNVSRDDMPEPRDFAEYVKPVQVSFFRDGDRVGMHSVGALGGPAMTAYGALIGQLMNRGSSFFSPLYSTLATDQLQSAAAAVKRFEAREKRMPKDLAELFVAEAFDDGALLIPGDEHAEELSLPGGRKVRVSYRYFPEPAVVEVFGNTHAARMICIEPSWNRVLLDTDGNVQQMWNEAGQTPIDQFAPAGK